MFQPGGGCFTADTPVATPEGLRPIGEMRPGDLVLAFDHVRGSWSPRLVEKVHENFYEDALVTIHTETDSIRATLYHPVWVVGGRDLEDRPVCQELAPHEDEGFKLEGRWVNSHDLRPGDVLIDTTGQNQYVMRTEQEFVSGFRIVNLTVEGDHTFAVGKQGLLVHNTCAKPVRADTPDAPASGNKIPNSQLQGPPPKRGRAPIGDDGHPVELHHRDQTPTGPLDEMTRTDHRLGENFKKNHSNTGQQDSLIDRKQWRKDQRKYWEDEFDSGRFDEFLDD